MYASEPSAASGVTVIGYRAPGIWVPMYLVEAAVRTGRDAEASAQVAAMRDADIAALSPRLALLAAGSAAIAAPDHLAAGLFADALALPGTDRWPFDTARVQLACGEHLRRARSTRKARVHLSAALQTFQQLGARPWAARAASELRAAGQPSPATGQGEQALLTPQEREIALLAAAGLTNKQIAERIFVSPRTVGAHLYRIFPRLGITSRAALRDALNRNDRDAELPPLRPAQSTGRHYQVAQIEPAPVNTPAVWTGSVGPKSLAATGRVADGWIPGHAAAWLSERYRTSRPVIDDAATTRRRLRAATRARSAPSSTSPDASPTGHCPPHATTTAAGSAAPPISGPRN
jgi:DNA-binding CsgD family transcriptional regulator